MNVLSVLSVAVYVYSVRVCTAQRLHDHTRAHVVPPQTQIGTILSC